MTMEEIINCGTLTEALWVPGYDRPAVEIRRDCPGKGEWTVVQRWPGAVALNWIYAGAPAERRAWRRYYLCNAEIATFRAREYFSDDEEAKMSEKNSGYYKPCGADGCAADGSAAPAPDLDPVRHKTYPDVESFRVALSEYATAARLNMCADWRQLTADLWQNGCACTCQPGAVPCPCPAGIAAAKADGECHCGLFIGHN